MLLLKENNTCLQFIYEASSGAGAQSVTVNRLVVASIPTRGDEIFTQIYISISSLWCRSKARRLVLPFNAQCLQNLAESGEQSVLTLGSLCLPCCVRDTAWSWINYYKKRQKKVKAEMINLRIRSYFHVIWDFWKLPKISIDADFTKYVTLLKYFYIFTYLDRNIKDDC